MRSEMVCIISMLMCLSMVQCSSAALFGGKSVVIVSEGDPRAVIVIPKSPHADEKLAAQEIVDHVKRMSGAELPIRDQAAADRGGLRIMIGQSLVPEAEAKIRKKGLDPASYMIVAGKDMIGLAGLSPEGTLFAAYDLLEQLGVRWFMPGEFGIVIPLLKTVRVPVQQKIEVPSFQGRKLQTITDRVWQRRMKLGGIDGGGHGFPIRVNKKARPDLYCEENGKPTHQIRVDHPEVLELTVKSMLKKLKKNPEANIAMGPADGAGFGSSPWDADDMDPLHGKISVTDRYVKFFNLALERVQKQFPDARISFYAYAQYMRPPVREKPNKGILPVLAPIDLCRFHSVENPLCPERQYMKDVISGWQALGCDMLYRGYFFNLADQGLPFSMIRQISEEIPYFKKAGIIGCRVECMPMWGHHAPSLYLATRLFWDVDADPDEIMADFFTKFYGPAAGPTHEYFDILEDAFYNADYHTGNVFDMPHILTKEVMGKLSGKLKIANGKIGKGGNIYADRVAGLQLVHDYGEANLAMMAALNDFEFEEAKRQHDQAIALQEKAIDHKPPLLWPRASKSYMRRFWSGTVNDAYACTQDGNEIAVELPDEWLFMIDPFDGGEDMGFWKPGMGTGNWTSIKTKSSSWSNQGMRYYKGEAWYRTSATVPKQFKGRKLRLWLGGIDDLPTAWINGVKLTRLKKGAAPSGKPWEFDATETIKFDVENVIVVKVSNRRINELGTGGITGPAMIWAEGK